MLFSQPTFLFVFLPVLLGMHALVPRAGRNLLLLVASLVFYAWGELDFTAVLLGSIAFNHWVGLRAGGPRGRAWLGLGVSVNLGVLALFKYGDFVVANLNAVLVPMGLPPVPLPGIPLPIGISFFTFQAISFLVDTFRGQAPEHSHPTQTALYISFFPQLIAGPIVRYHDIAAQIVSRRTTLPGFAYGVRRFTVGLAKKVLVADAVARPVDAIFGLPTGEISPLLAWVGIVGYTLQIYFDFSGYSDMAIGMGRMFGFRLLENFRFPYAARSITDFWRRWHISLSTWFRDYLYVPLGGNRRGRARTYVNLLLVFFLCGLWHGAQWTFVLWGLYHGVFLILERATGWRTRGASTTVVGRVYVMAVVMVGWVLFRSHSLAQAGTMLAAAMGLGTHTSIYRMVDFAGFDAALGYGVGLLASFPLSPRISSTLRRLPALPVWRAVAIGALLAYTLLRCVANEYSPFIYFRF